MRKNKLFAPLFLFFLITTFNIANAQTKIGIRTGLNFSNANMKDEQGNEGETESIPGFHLGLTVDVPIAGDFYIQPAALYSSKGFRQKGEGFGYSNDFKVTVSYLEVPVNLLYKPKLGTGNLILGAGGYLGYGTGGKWKSASGVLIGDIQIGDNGDVIFKNDAEKGEFGSYLYGKPLDYGASFLVGYELFNKYSVQFNSEIGLANLQTTYSGIKRKGKMKNTGFSISLGYKF